MNAYVTRPSYVVHEYVLQKRGLNGVRCNYTASVSRDFRLCARSLVGEHSDDLTGQEALSDRLGACATEVC